jgi:sialate O-acetylesterase
MNRIIFIFLLPFYSLFSQAEKDSLELAVTFTDNMILQRETNVPVWGFDEPKTKVTVEFAGQKKSVVTDEFGDWMSNLNL